MDKGFESWFQNQQIDWQSTNPNYAPFGFNAPFFGNPSVFAFAARKPEAPCGWLCRQGLTAVVNSTPKEQQLPEKKFLVFDQSNDQTTLIYSSTPMPYHLPKPQPTFDLKKENFVMEKRENIRSSNPFNVDVNDVESEMHEDSEELRALLYSDDEEIDYSEDEEEQSTGHSPSTMTGFDRRDEDLEEVASSNSCRKRCKRDSERFDVEDTASSGKSGVNCSGEAEISSCGNNSGANAGNGVPEVESETFPASKRLRKEKVRETISVLKDLIPCGKNGNDDAMVILDEAISFLRILKVKAQALGLDSL